MSLYRLHIDYGGKTSPQADFVSNMRYVPHITLNMMKPMDRRENKARNLRRKIDE
jgi:hypothetical protein